MHPGRRGDGKRGDELERAGVLEESLGVGASSRLLGSFLSVSRKHRGILECTADRLAASLCGVGGGMPLAHQGKQ